MESVHAILGSAVPLAGAVAVLLHLCWVGVRRGWGSLTGLDRMKKTMQPLKDRRRQEEEALADAACRLDEAKEKLGAAERRIEQLRKEIATLERAPPVFHHRLAAAGNAERRFRAEVAFDATAARAAGRPVNPAWRYANRLTVHAMDLAAARREADHIFPQKAGYTVYFHGPAGH
ncbi:hypothetical protein [Azospirillum picis]|uniref:Uncharacterized protein n=1 Tax=Azospirillum picis TaxID=488438 RepID=A0ABU0MKX0_9PROT|nr:hypothetical protein [Azospirillum picis]MBP2300318.1 hypothetical protein [Azospirillum picis]MDQ0534114.1 hypothetical protein [Azospirillum picis]